MPLFVCMPLYSFPHLILEGAPLPHAFKPLNKCKSTQELHFHLYILSIVLFFSWKPTHFWTYYRTLSLGKDYNCKPVILSYFLCLLSIFLSVLHVVCCSLFVFYPLYSFHHGPKSLNIDYIPCITKLTFAEEFLETKKTNNCLMSPFVILLFCTCVSGWNVAANSPIIVQS